MNLILKTFPLFLLFFFAFSCKNNAQVNQLEEGIETYSSSVEPNTKYLAVIATNVRLRSEPNINSKDNIIGRADRGYSSVVLDQSKTKNNIGDFGLNPWYKIEYKEGSAWIFGGLTNLAEDGKYAAREVSDKLFSKTTNENWNVVQSTSAKTIDWIKEIYTVSYFNPDDLPDLIQIIPYNQKQGIISALVKVTNNLQQGAMNETQMANEARRVHEKARAKMMSYGIRPGANSPNIEIPETMVFMWALEIQSVLQNQIGWENTISYMHINLDLAIFQIPALIEQFSSFDSDVFGQYMQEYTDQIVKETMQYATEEYVGKVERNFNVFILPNLN